MSKLESNWLALRRLDELAASDTPVHNLSPLAKILVTFGYLLVTSSFSRYDVAGIIPLALYPILLISLGNLPLAFIVKRLLFTLPLVVFIGIFNPVFDQTPLIRFGSFIISGGWVSFASILLRSLLMIAAAIILLATTGIDGICLALLRLKVPRVFIIQLLFMYRYIYVLLEEFIRTLRAYSLRSSQSGGIAFKAWGSLLGQLLLRTIGRAQRIYYAMLCRGFDGEIRLIRQTLFTRRDACYCIAWAAFFLAVRFVNIPQWLGALLMGGHR